MTLTEPHCDMSEALDAAVDFVIGYGRPPAGRPFAPGVSGNPMGRPRLSPLGQPGRRRAIPAEPTEIERALAEPVARPALADGSEGEQAGNSFAPVSLSRAVIARLTESALGRGDIAACRELLRLCAEAEAVNAERELLFAEREAAEREAAQAAEQAAEKRAIKARRDAQSSAKYRLEDLVCQGAEDVGETGLESFDRALKLLDAGEIENGRLVRLKPWVVDVAREHDPRLPRAGDVRPLNLDDPRDAVNRLEIGRETPDEEMVLTPWFIDAARARRPEVRFSRGDEALLQWVRREEGEDVREVDWVARLAAVEGGG